MTERDELHGIIAERVFITNKDEEIIDKNGNPNIWIFDFRKILLNGHCSHLITDLFYDSFKDQYPFQLCALEIAGVPLVTSLMNSLYAKGHEDINAFFIRKSRKKDGALRMIEGEINDTQNIILVDDIINSGNSFWRQIEVLEELGYTVDTVWAILRFRDESYYKRFADRGIKVRSLFTLNDFTKALGERIKNFDDTTKEPLPMPFTFKWKFQSENPSLGWVINKSQPIIDEHKLYFGSDNQMFWALNQSDGSVAWSYKVGSPIRKKSIFSNPVLYENAVIFGSYDGNVYALDKNTGEKLWVSYDADWVGSSPALAEDLKTVFIGTEFGLFRKHGGIIALDVHTGKPKWADRHPAYTHSSPLYIKKHKQVIIGSNDGKARLYDARSGKKIWECTTFGGACYDTSVDAGFGEGDIKESFVYYEKKDWVIFGSIDGFLYIVERKTGNIVHHHKCEFGIIATPFIYKDMVYFTSLDKHVRAINLKDLSLVFEKNIDHTRLFGPPTVINDRLYVGTNAARLHELDPRTGEQLGYYQALERITNAVVHNATTDEYFLPTFANEIIKLTREDGPKMVAD